MKKAIKISLDAHQMLIFGKLLSMVYNHYLQERVFPGHCEDALIFELYQDMQPKFLKNNLKTKNKISLKRSEAIAVLPLFYGNADDPSINSAINYIYDSLEKLIGDDAISNLGMDRLNLEENETGKDKYTPIEIIGTLPKQIQDEDH